MVDKRTHMGKMIDDTKIVFMCKFCRRLVVGNINTDTSVCPLCKNEEDDTLLIKGDLLIKK